MEYYPDTEDGPSSQPSTVPTWCVAVRMKEVSLAIFKMGGGMRGGGDNTCPVIKQSCV